MISRCNFHLNEFSTSSFAVGMYVARVIVCYSRPLFETVQIYVKVISVFDYLILRRRFSLVYGILLYTYTHVPSRHFDAYFVIDGVNGA